MTYFVKGNPQPGSLYVEPLLSDLATKIMNDSASFGARKMCTPVQVPNEAGVYHIFKGLMRDSARPLTENELFPEGSWDVEEGTYSAKQFGEAHAVTRRAVRNAIALDPERVATEKVVESLMIRQEKLFLDAVFSTSAAWSNEIDGYAANSSGLPWTHADADPIRDIDELRRQIMSRTGKRPNKLALSYAAYNAIKNNPAVVDRHKYTSNSPIGPQALAALFEVEEVVLLDRVVDNAASGLAPSVNFISGGSGYGDALLTHTSPLPSLEVPTAAAIFDFSEGDQYGIRITRWDEPERRRSMVAGETFFDAKIVSPALGAIAKGMLG